MKYPKQKCTAHKTNGDPCKAWAIRGGTVCRVHGGSAPQVKEAARRRYAEMLMPGLNVQYEIIMDPKQPAAVRLAAIKDVADRAGLRPVTVAEVTHITKDAVWAEIERLEAELAADPVD